MSSNATVKAYPEVIETELSVASVKFGGNAIGGAYFFAFNDRSILVPTRKKPVDPAITATRMVFKLSDVTANHFVITGLVASDSQGNLSPSYKYISPDDKARKIEVDNYATTPCLFNIGIMVTDLTTGTVICCDPQVTNTPDEGPN